MQDDRSYETLHHGIDMLSEARVCESKWRRGAKDNEPRIVILEKKKNKSFSSSDPYSSPGKTEIEIATLVASTMNVEFKNNSVR